MSNELRSHSPKFSIEEIRALAKEFYDLNDFIEELPSERDQNILFGKYERKFILKISNTDEEYSILDMQNQAIELTHNGIEIIPSIDGQKIVQFKNHFVRLVNYLPGIPLAQYKFHTKKLFLNLGKLLAQIDKILENFQHEKADRDLYWNMFNAETIVNKYKNLITDHSRLNIIETILRNWIEFVQPKFSFLRKSIIHNDANDYNIIIVDEDQINLIDYGDMCLTFTICELAIACAYAMLDKENPLESAEYLIKGYHQIYPLQDVEIELIHYFIQMRLAMSVTISAYQKQIQPDNEYLVISEKPAWNLLEKLHAFDVKSVQETFRFACNENHD